MLDIGVVSAPTLDRNDLILSIFVPEPYHYAVFQAKEGGSGTHVIFSCHTALSSLLSDLPTTLSVSSKRALARSVGMNDHFNNLVRSGMQEEIKT